MDNATAYKPIKPMKKDDHPMKIAQSTAPLSVVHWILQTCITFATVVGDRSFDITAITVPAQMKKAKKKTRKVANSISYPFAPRGVVLMRLVYANWSGKSICHPIGFSYSNRLADSPMMQFISQQSPQKV